MSSCALRIADFASSIAVLILSVNSLTISRLEGFRRGSKPMRGSLLVLSSGVDVIVVLELRQGQQVVPIVLPFVHKELEVLV